MNRKLKTAITGLMGNLILGAAKTFLSVLSGSAALLADAIHSFSDVLVSLMVIAGLKLNKKKIESIVTIAVGFIIVAVAIGFAVELFEEKDLLIIRLPIAITGQIVIIAATYLLYKYKEIIGKEENSESLVADSAHTKADMLSSIGVLISLSGQLIDLNLDRVAAFIIFFLILYQGLETIFSGLMMSRGIDNYHLPIKKAYAYLRRRATFAVIAGLLVMLYLMAGFYKIEQGSKGIRQINGRLIEKEIGAGLHFDLFHPLSEVAIINTSEIRVLEYGFRTIDSTADDISIFQMETMYYSGRYIIEEEEEEILTGDGSLASIHLLLEYSVSEPYKYLKQTIEPEEILRHETGASIRAIAGSLSLFDVLNIKREYICDQLLLDLNNSMKTIGTGIEISQVLLISATPHRETIYMFRNVENARQQKETEIYKAEEIKSRQLPYYRGLSYEKLQEAEALGESIRSKAYADTALYRLMEARYRENKDSLSFTLEMDSRIRLLSESEKILIDNSLNNDLLRIGGMQ